MTLPSFRLDEQTALVTGAASGIGRGIALGLATAGAKVACFDLPESALDEVCGEIGEAGRGAIAVPGDVMDADMLADAVRDAESEFGPLILAVNSAGIANAAPAEEMSLSQWQRVIDINVTGLFLSCQAESRAMLGHGRGAIVNIASMSGSIVNRGAATGSLQRLQGGCGSPQQKSRDGMGPPRHPSELDQSRLHGHTHESATRGRRTGH
jgi:NAD(P)-dependent dehydrogenase (short-subunit alcohol dehydrogenase family)